MKIKRRIRRYVLGGKMEAHYELLCAWASLLIILGTVLFMGWAVGANWSVITGFIARHF
jgi:hypothetical protein